MIPTFEGLKKSFQELFPDKKIKLKIQNRDKREIIQEI